MVSTGSSGRTRQAEKKKKKKKHALFAKTSLNSFRSTPFSPSVSEAGLPEKSRENWVSKSIKVRATTSRSVAYVSSRFVPAVPVKTEPSFQQRFQVSCIDVFIP